MAPPEKPHQSGSRSNQRTPPDSTATEEQPAEDISGLQDELLRSWDFESFSVLQLIAVRQSLLQCIQTCVSNNDFADAKELRQFGLDLQGQVKVLSDYRVQMSKTPPQSSLPALNPLFVSPEFQLGPA
jgi:hypothetical protein